MQISLYLSWCWLWNVINWMVTLWNQINSIWGLSWLMPVRLSGIHLVVICHAQLHPGSTWNLTRIGKIVDRERDSEPAAEAESKSRFLCHETFVARCNSTNVRDINNGVKTCSGRPMRAPHWGEKDRCILHVRLGVNTPVWTLPVSLLRWCTLCTRPVLSYQSKHTWSNVCRPGSPSHARNVQTTGCWCSSTKTWKWKSLPHGCPLPKKRFDLSVAPLFCDACMQTWSWAGPCSPCWR